jgi:hypothetical protein
LLGYSKLFPSSVGYRADGQDLPFLSCASLTFNALRLPLLRALDGRNLFSTEVM